MTTATQSPDIANLRDIAATNLETVRRAHARPTRRVHLLQGLENEPLGSFTTTDSSGNVHTGGAAAGSVALGNFNVRRGDQSWRLSATGADASFTAIMDFTPPLVVPPAAAVCFRFYVDVAAHLSNLEFDLFNTPSHGSPYWKRTLPDNPQQTLQNGWNTYRFSAISGDPTLTNWGTFTRLRIIGTNAGAVNVDVDDIWVECPPKAQLAMVLDWGATSFFGQPFAFPGSPYQALRARGVPVTLAWDPGNAGANPGGTYERCSVADVVALANDGNGNEISIHGYDGTATATMTAAQLRADYGRADQAIKATNIPPNGANATTIPPEAICTHVRAAFVQNAAANAAVLKPWTVALATGATNSGVLCWPPVDRWNLPRITLHGAPGSGNVNQTAVGTMFDTLQTTHGLAIPYTHGVGDNTQDFMSVADWAYFLTRLDAAIAAGWLECTTFNRLLTRSGGEFQHSSYGDVYIARDETDQTAVTYL